MMAPQAKSTMLCQMFREAPLAPTEETLILGDLALPTINLPDKPKFCTHKMLHEMELDSALLVFSVRSAWSRPLRTPPQGDVGACPIALLQTKTRSHPSCKFSFSKHHFHPFPHYLCACDHFDDSKRVHLSEMKPSWPRFHSSKSLRCLRKHCLFSWSL